MITRKIGSLLRGQATPFQVVAACLLGGLLGFAPAPLQAPALVLLLVAALLVVNANLGLALFVAGGARLLAWVAAPVSFEVGRFLLDGPTAGAAAAVVNAPVLAWCGLQYYAVAGGLPIGAGLGLVLGLVLARGIVRFRRRMLTAAENPSRWRELGEKRWAKLTIWLFFGGSGKQSWEQKLARRVGNPIRVWGAVLVVVLVAGAAYAHEALLGPLVRRGLASGLAEANGATAEVGEVVLDLTEGRFGVAGLALADPGDLDRDLFRAKLLEADVDEADLLRRRLHVGRLVISEVSSGAPREVRGELVERATEAAADEARAALPKLEDLTLEEVVAEYELWEGRLVQARHWLDRLAGMRASDAGPGEESLADRLARQARAGGWLSVQAEHLVDEAPTLRIGELAVEGLTVAWLEGRTFDLTGSELSTHPWLVDAPPRVELASRDGDVAFELDLAPVSRAGGDGAIRMHWNGLAVDDVIAMLKLPGPAPLRGGTIDLALDGTWADGRIGWLDLPLVVTLRDTTFAMKGLQETRLDELVLPIGLSGPLDAPRIRFDGSTFLDALARAGQDELVRRLRTELEGELGEQWGRLREKAGLELPAELPVDLSADLGEQLDQATAELQEEVSRKVEEEVEAKVQDEVEEEAAELLKGFLGGRP